MLTIRHSRLVTSLSQLAVLIAAFIVTLAPGLAAAQISTYVPTVGPLTVDGFMSATDATVCVEKNAIVADTTLPDGSFITQNKTVRLDGKGDVSGKCDWYIFGSLYQTQSRDIAKVVVGNQPPSLLASNRWIFPNASTQHLDSRIDGTTSGADSLAALERGTYTITFQSQALGTICDIQPQWSSVLTQKLNVVACIPTWIRLFSSPNDVTVHLPAGTVHIYVPSTMWNDLVGANNDGPLVVATNYWKTELSGLGFDFDITSTSCDSYGGACVKVEEGPVSGGCAVTNPGAASFGSDGTLSTPSTIRLLTGWTGNPVLRQRRTVAHELGHLLGLNHNDCATSDSVMRPPLSQGCSETTGFSESPSETDVLPVKSTYNNGSLKVCGGSL
jgi:hypothetical protein